MSLKVQCFYFSMTSHVTDSSVVAPLHDIKVYANAITKE